MCAYVSNGNNTPEVMKYIAPYLDAYKINEMYERYKLSQAGRRIAEYIGWDQARVKTAYGWEVVTLVIPGFNDSNEELWEARFLASLSLDIPWHVTAFHKDYKMTEPDNTDSKH